MDSDKRFEHLASDPRFKTLRRKQKKVVIDERFQSMFTDKKFTLKYNRNKRGRKQNKTSADDLKKYYSLEDKPITHDEPKSESSEESEHETDESISSHSNTEQHKEDSDQDEEAEAEAEEVSATSESEISSSSDESDSEEENLEEENQVDVSNIEFDWKPLDHDAETSEQTTQRLAIQNLDWDNLDVKDLYVLIQSVRMPLSVKIYISEFGKERLAKEEIDGPKEIVEMPKRDEVEEEFNDLRDKMRSLKNLEPKSHRVNEYEDADEEMDFKNEEIRERVRTYQLNRMKYYYAIAEFDSTESAELVYKELDGLEYEGSSLELDLRFVPDDVEFNADDIKAECDTMPDLASYTAPQFINTALQQTTVKFTWDETDSKRQMKLQRAYTKEELEKDDLEAYLASETDSDEDDEECNQAFATSDSVSVVTANSEARINKYKMLLKSLDDEAEKKKKVDVDVEWGDYEHDEQDQSSDIQSGSQSDSDSESRLDSDLDEEPRTSETLKPSKHKSRIETFDHDKRDKNQKNKKVRLEKSKGDKNKKSDGLEFMDIDDTEQKDDFEFDPDDDRFKSIYDSALYNIDPSHPNFKRTQAFDKIAERKRNKRRCK